MADLEFLTAGSIGQFWRYDGTLPADEDTPEYGWLSVDRHRLLLDTIDESDPWTDGDSTLPAGTAILGQLPTDAVLILDAWSRGNTRVLAGHNVSTQRHAAFSIVGGGIPLAGLRSANLSAVRAMYQSLSDWAGMVASEEQFTFEDGRISGFTLQLSAPTPVSAKIDSRRSITIEPKWSVGGPADRRVTSIPIAIGCTSTRPVALSGLLRPLLEIQSLLGMLFVGFVLADKGEAVLDLDETLVGLHRGSYPFWNGVLMVPPEGVPECSSMTLPLVDLRTVGGAAGLARWVRLCSVHPRATEVAVSPVRHGTARAEVELLTLGSALEYWVAAHRHLKWAKKQPNVKGQSQQAGFARAIASQAGGPFRSWVGDLEGWCTEFANAYNGLKHDPKFGIDEQVLGDLVVSARFLLLAVLLNRVSGSRAPAAAIFGNYRLNGTGDRLRRRYAATTP